MSKLIDADKLKESIRRNDGYGSWNESDVLCAIDREPEVLLSCPKCHGKGVYDVAVYSESCEFIGWNPTLCEVCKGTGKITLEFYEKLQRGCRK